MIRRLFMFLFVLSIVLVLALGTLWMRSRTYNDAVSFVDFTGASWSFGSRGEGFRIWHMAPWPVAERPELHSYVQGSNPLMLQLLVLKADPPWRWFGIEGIDGTATVPLSNATGRPIWAHSDEQLDWSICHTSPVVSYWCITMPQWQVLVAFGLIPVLMLVARLDRKWRIRRAILVMLTSVSLGLCLGTCTLWMMSYESDQQLQFNHEGDLWSMLASRGSLTVEKTAARAEEKMNDSTYGNLKKGNDRDASRVAEITSELDQNPDPEKKLALEQEGRRLDAEMSEIAKKMSGLQTPASESYSVPLGILAAISAILPLLVFGEIVRRRRQPASWRDPRCVVCGSSLAGVTDRCPQCGTPVA